MKLREFIDNLNRFVDDHPGAEDFEVITAKDDEGNGYNTVYYEPAAGNFEDGDFVSEDNFEDHMECLKEFDCDIGSLTVNAVCVN